MAEHIVTLSDATFDESVGGAETPIVRISSVPIIARGSAPDPVRERNVEHRLVWLITRPSLISQADRY